jgi:hypothetical protein
MDRVGAEHLRRAIDQHQNWCRAEAVRDGRQPSRDPDGPQLVEFEDDLRRYRSSDGSVFEKRLRDNFWVDGYAAA